MSAAGGATAGFCAAGAGASCDGFGVAGAAGVALSDGAGELADGVAGWAKAREELVAPGPTNAAARIRRMTRERDLRGFIRIAFIIAAAPCRP